MHNNNDGTRKSLVINDVNRRSIFKDAEGEPAISSRQHRIISHKIAGNPTKKFSMPEELSDNESCHYRPAITVKHKGNLDKSIQNKFRTTFNERNLSQGFQKSATIMRSTKPLSPMNF